MKWVLPFDWKAPVTGIHPKDSLFLMGSCFAENMANKLSEDRFDICQNPFGIIYNPASMANAFQICQNHQKLSEENLFYYNEQWHSELHHTHFSGTNKQDVLAKINTQITASFQLISQSNWIFLTFGTAKVYVSKNSGNIAGNCHKRPSKDFETRTLSVQEIVEAWSTIIHQNADKHFYFSVSPVRYVREGLVASNHSKAILRMAIMQLTETFPNAHYFPAYELVVDVLRDYRFYAKDLVHPNEQAIDFVYDFFKKHLLSPNANQFVEEWSKIQSMMHHKSLNPNSEAWKSFETKRNADLEEFEKRWGL